MALERSTFTVRGIYPMLMSSPLAMVKHSEAGIGKKKIPTAEDEAESRAYRLEGGQLYVPSAWFRNGCVYAVRGRRIGKMAAPKLFTAFVFPVEERLPLVDPETGEPLKAYEIDVRRCVVAKSGIMRARPRIPRWQTSVTFDHDTDFISYDHIKEALDLAGRMSGCGDFRPSSPGGKRAGYGRYQLVSNGTT